MHLKTLRQFSRSTIWLALLLAISSGLVTGCGLSGLPLVPVQAGKDPQEVTSYQPAADATATPTPFQPIPPTPTYLPPTATPEPVDVIPVQPTDEIPVQPVYIPDTATPTASPSPTQVDIGTFPPPSLYPDIAVPPPVGLLPQPAGQVNILLLGSDQLPGDYGFRTDTILLLTINPQLGTANLTSFPRDLYVYIPGWTVNRINTAFAYGGFKTLAMTMEYNLGVRPDHFVMINFDSFIQVIDSLGGLDVYVTHPYPYDCDGVPSGNFHMSGAVLLCYVRERQTTSDFDRAHRQQEVLQALMQRILRLDIIARAPELYQIYAKNVTTDLVFSDIAPLLPLATHFTDTSRLHHYYIGHEQVTDWMNSYGAMVLLPKREAILEIMRQALNSP
jgi:LCP family protein required for cell wall assembly